METGRKPKSPHEQTGGLSWFPRMLDKIRLHAAGDLHPDFHPNLGIVRSVDGFCCAFLHVDHAQLTARVLAGGSDDEILEWCFEHGRNPNRIERMVWNEFVRKFGWNDMASPILENLKQDAGLAARDDLRTMVEFMDVDEGRRA